MLAKRCISACGAVNRRLRSPLARDEDNLPLPKPIKGVILISKLPGIWQMSANILVMSVALVCR
jgi:hypothetical protein